MSSQNDDPIIARDDAPDHGPHFWAELDSSIQATPLDAMSDPTEVMPRLVPLAATSAVPKVQPSSADVAESSATRRRSVAWPLAAAAAVLAILGLGVMVIRGPANGDTSEIVAGEVADADVALDGPDDGTSFDPDGDAGAEVDEAPTTDSGDAATIGQAEGDGEGANQAGSSSGDPDAAAVATNTDDADVASPAAPIPEFDDAGGVEGEPLHLPLDQGVPATGLFLANWPESSMTWYAVPDSDLTCASANYSEIRYVNGSGFTQPVRDPQLRFSGELSHFVVQPEQNLAAWVSSCGSQLELYVATLESTGQIDELTLAWIGEGSAGTALVLWEEDEVSLNTIEPGGTAFNVDYNVSTKLLSRNGGPSRIMLEAGAPAARSLTPLAASPDGVLTYWQGKAPAGTLSACNELFGSGVSDTLWLRQGEGQWQLAVVEDQPLGSVTALALEPEFSQVAFADLCDGVSGRIFLGTQRADGSISNLREIDLSPFVPGFAAQLHWVDSQTLRIETDNTGYGFGTVRFDFRLDDGRENGVIVQLD